MDERASKKLYRNRTAKQQANNKSEQFRIHSDNPENELPENGMKCNQPLVTFKLSEQYEQPCSHNICKNEGGSDDQPLSLQEELKLSIENTEIQTHMEDRLGNDFFFNFWI